MGKDQITGPTPPFLSKWKEKLQGATLIQLCELCCPESLPALERINMTPNCSSVPSCPLTFFFFNSLKDSKFFSVN